MRAAKKALICNRLRSEYRPVGCSESEGGSFSRKWNSQRQGVWGPLSGSRWGARGRSPLKLWHFDHFTGQIFLNFYSLCYLVRHIVILPLLMSKRRYLILLMKISPSRNLRPMFTSLT